MKKKVLLLTTLIFLSSDFLAAQDTSNFFPHNVGNRWDYDYWTGGYSFYSTTITKDSVDFNGSKFLFYDNDTLPKYKIDTLNNVYLGPFFQYIYLFYKLNADSGEAWFNPDFAEWEWVARIDTGIVFSRISAIKVFQYGPAHPDSTPFPYVLRECWLADGFGLIYQWEEPGYFYAIKGCIVESDTFGILTSVEPLKEFPIEFSLKQNYPNPFNPSTTIEFTVQHSSEVSLTIYDILGREVSTLLKDWMGFGNYKFQWNAEGLTSGVYFCRLIVNGNIKTIKMMLTK
jgi:hypothetical protein